MLKPTKFLDLNNCIINISSEILKMLISEEKVQYGRLYSEIQKKYDNTFECNFLPALDFLFLLGKIKYSSMSDCVELIK